MIQPMNMKKPIIGIILDWQQEGSFSSRPHYALRTHYFQAIEKAGGIPFGIPFEDSLMDSYLELIDGILAPGGFFASPDAWYDLSDEPIATAPSERAAFEEKFIRQTINANIPFLGICAGMQGLCGALGGKLCKNVHTAYNTDINHLNGTPPTELAHEIAITPNSLLHHITGKETLRVNSAHTEAVTRVPEGISITATAPDGVTEAVEMPDKKFVLGVQWHPEFFLEEGSDDLKLFKAFIEAARG